MFKKIHNILGKLFLSGASFFWVSCDSGASAEGSKPFIDVDQELAKLMPTDTTGLKGKCIPVYQYCDIIDGWDIDYKAEGHAKSIAVEKIDSQHKGEPNYWYESNSCYRDLLSGLGIAPDYGVPSCPSELTPCELEEPLYRYEKGVRIDDAYIEALPQRNKKYRELFQKTLEKINQGMEDCN